VTEVKKAAITCLLISSATHLSGGNILVWCVGGDGSSGNCRAKADCGALSTTNLYGPCACSELR
jgi:hypothetical protein